MSKVDALTCSQGAAVVTHYRKSRRAQSVNDHETWVEDEVTNTINTFDVGDIRATDVVAQPVAFRDPCPTLTARMQGSSGWAPQNEDAHLVGVAQPVNIYGGNKRADRPEGGFYARLDEDTSKCLDAASGLNPTCSQGGTAVMQPYVGGVDYENNAHAMDEPTGPLMKGSPTGGGRPLPAIATAMQVRRLTPVECERLQGFPDGYTNIPWRKSPESPDGPRYKALGNSMAVPCMKWIGERIQQVREI
jgi:site-specific DNA-cytosine methylase